MEKGVSTFESSGARTLGGRRKIGFLARAFVALYLVLALADLFVWFAGGLPAASSISVYNLFSLLFYASGIAALLCFFFRRTLLSGTTWRAMLLGYLLFRYLELKMFGAVLVQGDMPTNSYKIARYLFIAAPPAGAMLYLGFVFRARVPARTQTQLGSREPRSTTHRWSDNLLP